MKAGATTVGEAENQKTLFFLLWDKAIVAAFTKADKGKALVEVPCPSASCTLKNEKDEES
jgi:hypothetical protein